MAGKDLLGLEVEVMLIEENGNISNRASDVFKHSNISKLVPEFSTATIEANPDPSNSIQEIEKNLRYELENLEIIANSMGVKVIPISEVGKQRTQREGYSRRYELFEKIAGSSASNVDKSAVATHLHIDHKNDIVGQYNLLQSMDPVFVLMSTTSYFRGFNTVNCGRLNSFRSLFPNNPEMNNLLDYIKSPNDLDEIQKKRSNFFISQLGDNEESRSIFGSYNNGSSPLRKTDKTIEIRCADGNLPELALSFAAMYKGVLNSVFNNSIEIKISEKDGFYDYNSSEIIMPNFNTLKKMEKEGIKKGLKSDIVYAYLNHLLEIANDGLSNDEQKYLIPFENILLSRTNVADLINHYAKSVDPSVNGRINLPTADKVNLFINQIYQSDIKNQSQLNDLIKYKDF